MKAPLAQAAWVAVALVVVAVARIVSTYHDFNQAYDEPAHIACGMEWLDKGTFNMEPQHPPLPRVMSALGPYLAGLRLPEVGFAGGNKANGYDFYTAGNQILFARGQYLHILTLARLGTLPFLVIAAWITFLWTRSLVGEWPAVLAVLLLTTMPVVLGYSTLAYVDPALMAMFPAALFACVRWLERPSWQRSLALGAALAGMALANAPWMVFFPPCAAVILACRWWVGRAALGRASGEKPRAATGGLPALRRWVNPAILALAMAGVVLWAGYRFSVERLNTVFENPRYAIEHVHLPSPVKAIILKVIDFNPPLPAPAFFQGIGRAIGENGKLYPAYLFGQVRRGGWWYFYFFMLAFKTPPGALLLGLAGLAWALRRFWVERDWQMAAPAVALVAILLVAMTIRVNLGVRTILFLYPLLAVLGGVAGQCVWFLRAKWPKLAPAALLAILAWLVLDGVDLHPNYLTYTSALAGRPPDYSLVLDADFDAGQNVLRLAEELRKHGVDHLKLRLYTSADLLQMGLPPFETLAPYEHATGWVAISVHNLRTGEGPWIPAQRDGYEWLTAYPSVPTSVDKTIRLYHLPEPGSSATGRRVFLPAKRAGA